MSDQWHYQVRVYFDDALAETARRSPDDPALGALPSILENRHASIRCQYDAFVDYVAEAEREGIEGYPLYAWTKATIEDPVKKAKHLKSFALHINGQEVYPKEQADALEAELLPLVDNGVVARVTKHDTNSASNPQPPEQYRRSQA